MRILPGRLLPQDLRGFKAKPSSKKWRAIARIRCFSRFKLANRSCPCGINYKKDARPLKPWYASCGSEFGLYKFKWWHQSSHNWVGHKCEAKFYWEYPRQLYKLPETKCLCFPEHLVILRHEAHSFYVAVRALHSYFKICQLLTLFTAIDGASTSLLYTAT